VFGHAGEGPNVLGSGHLERLDAILGEVERGVGAGAIAAVVVRSARPGSWISGADLRQVSVIRSADEGAAIARAGQRVLRRLETLAVPTFAAVDGACLGAGAELALACSYRLACDHAATELGFPEVRYGLLPALGGTVRLPRLLGVRAALELILTGRPLSAAEARACGLVDEVYPAADFSAGVLAFVRARVAGGRVRTGARRGMARRLVEDTAPGRRALFARARRDLLRARGAAHNPAGLRALEVIAGSAGLLLERAFEVEAEAFGALAAAPESHALMHAFSLRRIARRPPGLPDAAPLAVETVAVLGGGAPAGALAHLLTGAGMTVRVRDADPAAAVTAVRWVREAARLDERMGDVSAAEGAARVRRVSAARGFGGFGTVDLALELALGGEERKRALLAQAEAHLRSGAMLGTTAVSLTVSGVAASLDRPERLGGIRFFPSPADPRAAEVARSADGETAATLYEVARRAGVTALLVDDVPGGLLHRLALAFVQEGIALVAQGAEAREVEDTAGEMGLREGPLLLADLIGLPALARLAAVLHSGDGDPIRSAALLEALVRREVIGSEAGRGFYSYRTARSPRLVSGVEALLRTSDGTVREVSHDEIVERLLLSLVNEGARALGEGVVSTADEVDLAAMLGFGFPAYRGGLLYEAERTGLAGICARLDALAEAEGPRFEPAPLLRTLAAERGGFPRA
jgi:3-hydroxyacyl-CoA dehydrogenase/enoyl-CoA hydratase/3-hydroxybutyryl-CoA epimerase